MLVDYLSAAGKDLRFVTHEHIIVELNDTHTQYIHSPPWTSPVRSIWLLIYF